jgi:hypothetical protein
VHTQPLAISNLNNLNPDPPPLFQLTGGKGYASKPFLVEIKVDGERLAVSNRLANNTPRGGQSSHCADRAPSSRFDLSSRRNRPDRPPPRPTNTADQMHIRNRQLVGMTSRKGLDHSDGRAYDVITPVVLKQVGRGGVLGRFEGLCWWWRWWCYCCACLAIDALSLSQPTAHPPS